ncbi:MAG: cya 3 [Planctomycetaceae bacterium]|nr:cya 3 [Planctomycetaceae bacterium]
MLLMSWIDFLRISGKNQKKTRKPTEPESAPRMADAVRLEVLEDRALLSAVMYNSVTQQLSFTADSGVDDDVQISRPDASTLQIHVAAGDVISLQGAAAANPDFVLTNPTTLTINTSQSDAFVDQLSVDLGDGANQLDIGSLSLNGISIFNGGTVNLGALTVDTGGLSVTAQNITVNGLIQANDGGGVTLEASGGAVASQDNLTINADIHALGTTSGGQNGTLNLQAGNNLLINGADLSTIGNGIIAASSGFSLGTGALTMTGAASIHSDTGQITLSTTGNGTLTALSLTTNAPDLQLTGGTGDVVLNGTLQNTAGNISVNAGNTILVNGSLLASGTGSVTLAADSNLSGSGDVQLGNGGSVAAIHGDVNISGSDADLSSGNVIALQGQVQLKPAIPGAIVNIGTDLLFGLTLADLQHISAAELIIGSEQTGNVDVTSPIHDLATPVLGIGSAGSILQQPGATLTVNSLGIIGKGPVILDENNHVGTLAVDLSQGANSPTLSFTNADNLSVGSVAGVTGISTSAGAVGLHLSTAGTQLSIDQPILTGTGSLIALDADNLQLNAAVNAGSDEVFLVPQTTGVQIDLGTQTSGRLSLTNAELNQVTAGMLVIGSLSSSAAGNVTISAPIAPAGVTRLAIVNVNSIQDQNTNGIDITVPDLLLKVTNGIATTGTLTTAVGGLEATTANGDISIDNTGDLTIGGLDSSLHGLSVQNNGSVRLTNHGSVFLSEADAESLQAGLQGGDVVVQAIGASSDIIGTVNQDLAVAPHGSITMTAGRDFESGMGGLAYDGDLEADNSLTINAGRDVLLGGDADLRSDAFGDNTGGNLTVSAGRNVTLQGNSGTAEIPSIQAGGTNGAEVQITTGADGILTLAADNPLTNSNMVSTASGDVNLIDDHVVFSGYSIINSAGAMAITPKSAGWKIDLGSSTDLAAGTLELSNAELNHIATGILRIGSAQSGDINLTAAVTLNDLDVPTLSLISGGAVSDQGVGTLAVNNLRVSAQGEILLDTDGDFINLVALHSEAGDISFFNSTDLTVGSVDGVDGASTVNHNLEIGTSFGILTVANTPADHDLDSGTGQLTFGSLSLTGMVLSSGADARGMGGVEVIGNQQQLDGTITATGQNVSLLTANQFNSALPSIPIDLGGADSLTQLGISDAELDRIDTGVITIGTYSSGSAGAISVTGQITPRLATTLFLVGGAVVQSGGSITVPSLAMYTNTGVGTATPLQTQVSQLAFYNLASGDVVIDNAGALTVASIQWLGTSQNSGGGVVLTTTGALTTSESILTTGDIILTAIDSFDPGDDLVVNQGSTIASASGNITLNAGDALKVLGSVEVDASAASITLAGGKDDVDGAGSVTLDGNLTTYDTSPQIFGGSGNDTITINQNDGAVLGGVVGLNIDGGTGNDTYILNFGHGSFTRDIAIDDASGVLDQLKITGQSTNDTVSYDSSLAVPTVTVNNRTITFAGLETANIDAGGANGDVLHLAENVPGFLPVGNGSIGTVVPLTFSNFETVTIANTIPTVAGLNVTASTEGGTATLTGTFDDAEHHLGQTFVLHVDWGDGSAVQNVPIVFTAANQSFSLTHTYVDDNPSGTSQDDYPVSVTVTDDNGGTSLAGNVAATVMNANPTISVLNFSTAVDEGSTLTFTGTYTDAGTADTHQLLVGWNDGTPVQTFNVSNGVFAVSHIYLDEDLSGTAGDVRFPTLTIQDDDGGTAVSHPQVVVHNVAPSFNSLSVTPAVIAGNAVTLSGTYSDPGILDTQSLQIDWGDGSDVQTVPVTGGQFSLQHTYLNGPPAGMTSALLTITATLSDNDGGTVTQTTSTTLSNPVATLANVTLTAGVYENGIATLAGDFVNTGSNTTHTLSVDWADGGPPETIVITGNSFSLTHQYLDDNPTGTIADNLTVSLHITDVGSDPTVVTEPITVVNAIPSIDSFQLSATNINENGSVTLSGTYSDVGTLDTHILRVNWGDNSGMQTVNVTGGVFSLTHQYLDDAGSVNGAVVMSINMVLVDDDLGMNVQSTQVTVHNVSPTVTINGAPTSSPEGTAIALTSTVTDPGTLDTQTYAWSVTKNGNPFKTGASPSFSFTPDDAGSYVVSLAVTDNNGGTGTATSQTIAVTEVAPTVGITGPATVAALNPTQFTLLATDPSTVDQAANFTFHIDWNGDGTTEDTIVGPSGTVVTHAFSTAGDTTIKVTATDKDGATSSVVSKSISVAPILFQDGVLSIGGTSGNDQIRVKDLGNGNVQVSLNGTSLGRFTPQLIRIYGGDGDDRIQVDSTARMPVELYGGAGNDSLTGGKADDLLDGGTGNDRLNGGRGNDILVGGDGNDSLSGASGNDLLIGGLGSDDLSDSDGENIQIGGMTIHDQSSADLNAIRSEWLTTETIDQRIAKLKNGGGANGQVTLLPPADTPDDAVQDKIHATNGSNWLISFVTDRLYGATRSKNRNN